MSNTASNTPEAFNRLYEGVATGIAAAAAEIDQLEVEHKNGRQEIGNILERLRRMQTGFDQELSMLKEHAEWEKFTIAFFGETNAGKSTIIESLRILFSEESRQQLLEQNGRDLQPYEAALRHHLDTAREGFAQAHATLIADIANIRRDIDVQTGVLLEAASTRTAGIKVELAVLERTVQAQTSALGEREEEVAALKQTVQTQSSTLAMLEKALKSARSKVWLGVVGGCILGAAVSGALSFALR
jgi:hypothetical protein